MKKSLACMLAFLLLIMLTLPAAFSESNAPKPTPPPTTVAEGGVPVHTQALKGMDAAKWKEAFLSCAEELGVPVEEGGFVCVTEWPRREAYEEGAFLFDEQDAAGLDSVDRMHRVMAGGAEVFVQEVDDTTAVQFVVLLDYDLLMPDVLADALCYYFPLVMRACIYASEPGATKDEVERIQEELCPDLSWLIHNKLEVEAKTTGDAARYYFSTLDFSFTDKYSISFSGTWEEVDVENDDTVQAQTSVTELGDSLDGTVEERVEEERTDASGQWKYVLEDGGATIMGYEEKPSAALLIPSELDGRSVTGIGVEAFSMCGDLIRVVIPDTVTEIGEWAFKECIELTGVIFGNNVTRIGEMAFFGCESLTSVTLPGSVTGVGGHAFAHCYSLSRVTVPASVTSIGEFVFHAFYEEMELEPKETVTLYVEEGSYAEQYAKENDILYIYGAAESERLDASGQWFFVVEEAGATITGYVEEPEDDLVIPSELDGVPVTAIGKYGEIMYWLRNFNSVTIPSSVTRITDYTFFECNIPTLYAAKGSYAVQYAKENEIDYVLTGVSGQWKYELDEDGATITGYMVEPAGDLVFPHALDGYPVKGIGVRDPESYEKGFAECADLISVTIPEGVTSIYEETFMQCSSLTSVTLPDSVTYISEYVFSWCENLTSVTIPDGVTYIGDTAFEGCGELVLRVTEGSYGEQYAEDNGIPYAYADGTIIVPTQVPGRERKYASGQWMYVLEDGGAKITDFLDKEYEGVLAIPGELDGHPVTGIGKQAFMQSWITGVTIPDSVTGISNEAFFACRYLSSVVIPNSVTGIGNIAFFHCVGLTDMTIPNSVTYIGKSAFYGCEKLILSVAKGSYAEEYAKGYQIPYETYEADPNPAYACYTQGNAYADMGQYDLAIADYTEAIALSPGFIDAYMSRGLCYGAQREYDIAIADFTKIVALIPDYTEAYNYRGVAYDHQGLTDLAIADYTNAIAWDPGYANPYNNRGAAYSDQGQFDLAITDFTRAIALNPDYIIAYNNRGIAYGEQGQFDLAIADYTKAIELYPEYMQAYNNRADAYEMLGDMDAAASDRSKAEELIGGY